MKLGTFFGLLLIAFGLVITFLLFQGWYIDWLKERLPMERSRLIRGEQITGNCLLFKEPELIDYSILNKAQRKLISNGVYI